MGPLNTHTHTHTNTALGSNQGTAEVWGDEILNRFDIQANLFLYRVAWAPLNITLMEINTTSVLLWYVEHKHTVKNRLHYTFFLHESTVIICLVHHVCSPISPKVQN